MVGSCPPINSCMKIFEIVQSTKPLTPAQGRINSLKRQVDAAKNALTRERQAQAQQKIQLRLQKLAAQKV